VSPTRTPGLRPRWSGKPGVLNISGIPAEGRGIKALIENPFVERANRREGIEGSRIPVVLRDSYAQCGEDLIVEALLRVRLHKQRRQPDSLTYIELGANHPIATSNSFMFYDRYGARGVLVEADPSLIACLQRVRPRDTIVNVAISATHAKSITLHVAALSELSSVKAGHTDHFAFIEGNSGVTETIDVPNMHVNDFLRRYTPRNLDFLSIDCEGIDVEIIAALDFRRFRPYIVQCEPSDHIIPGASRRITSLMERRGYRLIAVTDVNLIFVRTKQASAWDLSPGTRLRGLARRVVRRLTRIVASTR